MSRSTAYRANPTDTAECVRRVTHQCAIDYTGRACIASVAIAAIAGLFRATPFGASISLVSLALFVALIIWVPVWVGKYMKTHYGSVLQDEPIYGRLYALSKFMHESVEYEYWIISYILLSLVTFLAITYP